MAQDGATIRVSAESPGPGDASVIVAGPTGECVIPVRLTMPDTESEPPPPPPEPEPQPKPAPQPQPTPEPEPAKQAKPAPAPQPEPPQERAPRPAASSTVPWWLIGVLILGALFLILVNWPGSEDSRKLWYDESNTGWYVYRSWGDPMILASFGALVASLAARWWGPVALGIVAGCVAFVLEDGLLILVGGISADETSAYAVASAAGAVMAAVLLIVLWPKGLRLWPVAPSAAVPIVAGGILLLVALGIEDSDGHSLLSVTLLFLLDPVVVVALAWSALAAVETRARTWLTAAAVTVAALGVIGAVPAWTTAHSAPVFMLYLVGNALIAVGVLIPVLRPPSRP